MFNFLFNRRNNHVGDDPEYLRELTSKLSLHYKIAQIISTVPNDEMYKEVAQALKSITKSKFVAFCKLNEYSDFVCPSYLMNEIWEQCSLLGKDVVFKHDDVSKMPNWGRFFRKETNKGFFVNGKIEVPKGHIAIKNFMIVPITFLNILIGVLAFANKKGKYTNKDLITIEGLTIHIAPVLAARLDRDALEAEVKKAGFGEEVSLKKLREQASRVELFMNNTPEGEHSNV